MLSPEDIKNLTEYQKLVFVTKQDFDNGMGKIQESMSTLQTSVDGMSKEKQTNEQERIVQNRRIKDVEEWVGKAAPKIGLEFKH